MRWLWLPMLAGTIALVASAVRDDTFTAAAVYGVVGLFLSWWLSPWQGGGRRTQAYVDNLPVSDRRVVIYWRPGCVFCARLRARLRGAGRHAVWVNIWQDPDAAAFVREVNDGDETVPTVLIDDEPFTNPDPRLVLDRLRA